MMPRPRPRRSRSTSNSRSVSAADNDAVGSSRTRTEDRVDRARAISTVCCWAGPRARTGARAATRAPRLPSRPWAARAISPRRSSTPPRSRPRKMFSAALSSGTSASSWYTTFSPRCLTWSGSPNGRGEPASFTSPESGTTAPPRTLMNVDLPAPFSPSSAWISPRPRSKSTPSRARTPGKVIDTPDAARRGPSGSGVILGSGMTGRRDRPPRSRPAAPAVPPGGAPPSRSRSVRFSSGPG